MRRDAAGGPGCEAGASISLVSFVSSEQRSGKQATCAKASPFHIIVCQEKTIGGDSCPDELAGNQNQVILLEERSGSGSSGPVSRFCGVE